MSVVLLNGRALAGAFQPTAAMTIAGNEITLYFALVTSSGPTTVQWYLEFSDNNDPAGAWYRETAEEDAGQGVVLMPKVVRTFADEGSTQLADGNHFLDAEFKRRNKFVRVQMRVSTGGAVATVEAPFGLLAA